ncbi:hypothetical protein [Haloprofundus salinisoli]|nr:hypothetical protein [Haloprofundus salinisoli]
MPQQRLTVLPGVGAFGECVRNSESVHDVLVEAAEDTPILHSA